MSQLSQLMSQLAHPYDTMRPSQWGTLRSVYGTVSVEVPVVTGDFDKTKFER